MAMTPFVQSCDGNPGKASEGPSSRMSDNADSYTHQRLPLGWSSASHAERCAVGPGEEGFMILNGSRAIAWYTMCQSDLHRAGAAPTWKVSAGALLGAGEEAICTAGSSRESSPQLGWLFLELGPSRCHTAICGSPADAERACLPSGENPIARTGSCTAARLAQRYPKVHPPMHPSILANAFQNALCIQAHHSAVAC